MTREDSEQLDRIIEAMSDADKAELVERLRRAMEAKHDAPPSADRMTDEQLQAVKEVLEEIASLPVEEDPYASLGYSNEAHDKILYDLEQS
jgi:hypothetical protein